MVSTQAPVFAQKPHYMILDGLRGVASVMVVIFHIFETHGTPQTQFINHGYLAVDFFFLLSGFVIGYAYDDRWAKGMTMGGFLKRRLTRLHPMVVMGSVMGALLFYFAQGEAFPLIGGTPVWQMLLMFVFGCLMLPMPVSMDIRGWRENYPLNGPAWTLFLEYVANLLYATVIRRFGKRLLTLFVVLAALLLIHYSVTCPKGCLAGGWSLTWGEMRVGFTRLLFPFFGGLLLFRMGRLIRVKHAFLWCSLCVVALLSLPRLGVGEQNWVNGLYESLVVIFVFPLIVAMGAGGELKSAFSSRICKLLGDLSYPLYITHYPVIYIYTAYVCDNRLTFAQTWPYALLVFVAVILIAYLALYFYDLPVRGWLKRHWLNEKK